jgi:glycine/D-amino acid oxidase-like deaminating enzyme
VGSKGEYLIIKAPELSRERIVKGVIFIAPIENDLFWIGASFSQKDKTDVPTDLGKDWLIQKLNSILNIPYEVINHEAAVRPTVSDRRPLLGVHPSYSNLYVFNGLGTRGVLMAPKLSQWLYEFVHQRKQFPNEVAIDRFESYFSSPKTKYV